MLNQKIEITRYVIDKLQIKHIDIKQVTTMLWQDPREKISGGFRLTEQGYHCLINSDLKDYLIKFDEPIYLTNQLTIWLDHFIDCPFYLKIGRAHV